MFRLWCKLFDNSNHMIKDMVAVNDDPELNRTRKIFDGIKEACYEFDLSEPMWFDSNIADFKRHSKVRFTSDNFIDDIDFHIWRYRLSKRTNPLFINIKVYSLKPDKCSIIKSTFRMSYKPLISSCKKCIFTFSNVVMYSCML